VLNACRACTHKDPTRRVPNAAEAVRTLTERRRWRLPRLHSPRRALVGVGALGMFAAIAVGFVRLRQPDRARAEYPLIVPTGEPADWADISMVLAEVPERIPCMIALPDRRTLRIVWGHPARAEDIDTQSRERRPSPLVAAAYAEGCPDLSPDGQRLLYPGHVEDGRAFAFVSEHADGSKGQPVVATAEPSQLSEPRWLADGKAFSYDVDTRHIGIYSLETNRGVVVPGQDDMHFSTQRWTIGNQVLLQKLFLDDHTEFAGHLWPALSETVRFRLDGFSTDVTSAERSTYYYVTNAGDVGNVVAVTPANGSARRIGMVRGQRIRHLVIVDDGLSFVSMSSDTAINVRVGVNSWKTIDTGTYIGHAVSCGGGLLVSELSGGQSFIARRTLDGSLVARLTTGPSDYWASCSADGRRWTYVRTGVGRGLIGCDDNGCGRVIDKDAIVATVAPDGAHIAFLAAEKRGLAIFVSGADGTDLRQVTETETMCPPTWSSSRALWVARRHGRAVVWTEVDVHSGQKTGKQVPGTTDCTNGDQDPAFPVDSDVRVVVRRTAQVRLVPSRYLAGGE